MKPAIRRLVPEDAAAFQALRLAALLESPTAFGSSHAEECDRSLDEVARSLDACAGRVMFGAFEGGVLVGLVGVGRESSAKEQHRGFIRSMYVRPDQRGQGIARALLQSAVDHAWAQPGLRQLHLEVTAGNAAAVALYEAFGFSRVGVTPAALCVDGVDLDELQLFRRRPAP